MDWKPFPKQEFALQRIEYEILFGGSRGGGKTDAGLVWLTDCIDNSRYRALVIRKNAEDLGDWVDRATRFYGPLGAKVVGRPPEIRFPSGAIIKTGHLKDDQAYTKYQGHEYQRMLVEELTQIPDEKRYQMLIGSCRTTVPGIKAQIFATTNPGSLGHVWVKERFVDPAPPMTPFKDKITGRSRIYIPATVDDNPALMETDPGYVAYLEGLKDTDVELWKAWRWGDWSTFAGQFFREWRTDLHVCKPFIPKRDDETVIVGGLDWGRTDLFVLVLDVVTKVSHPDGSFLRSRTFLEITGNNKTPWEWSIDIKTKLHNFGLSLDDIAWVRCDNQIFNLGNDKGKSIFDQFVDQDERWRSLLKAASKERVGGWENLHNWLSIAPDDLPYWQIAENCQETIKSITTLIHDDNKVEDVDSSCNDHASDAERYQKKHLKWINAGVGGVRSNYRSLGPTKPVVQINDDGQQIAINLDLFSSIHTNSTHVVNH